MTNTYDTSVYQLGSKAPKVVYNNASNIDDFANGLFPSWVDRPPFNRTRLTIFGMEQQFNNFLINSGYEPNHLIYSDGNPLQVDRPTQLIDRAGLSYRIKLPAPTPFPITLTGTWATDQNLLVELVDSDVRSDVETLNGQVVSVRGKTLYAMDAAYGFVNSPTADNTAAVNALLAAVSDGDTVDFCGVMWRIYGAVPGIVSAGANPATDQAVPLTSVPRLVGRKNVTIKNGGLYAANQGVSPDKRYYPSTLYLKGCHGILFGDGAKFESRGENFGDSDASLPLSFDNRQDFLAKNGGHAVVMVRCSNILGSVEGRLCGSAGVIYAASCSKVRLYNSFANAASLGYAAYAVDSWCGGIGITGFSEHSAYFDDCYSNAEALTRREDAATVGSSVYASKGAITGEDQDVYFKVSGGAYGDCYGNGSTDGEYLGHAFSANSCTGDVTGARVFNVAYAGATLNSADVVARLFMRDVTGTVGAAAHVCYPISFGQQEHEYVNCTLHVDGSRLLGSISETAYVINKVVNTQVRGTLRGNSFTGAKQILWRPAGAVSYGWIDIDGGSYQTNGYLCSITGWGGNASGSRRGVTLRGGVTIEDVSAATDAYIKLTNVDGAVLNFLWFDARDAVITTALPRNIDGIVNAGAPNLQERVWMPGILNTCYSTRLRGYRQAGQVTYINNTGLAGPNLKITLQCDDGYPVMAPTAIVGDGAPYIGISAQVSAPVFDAPSGKLRHEVFCRGSFTEGTDLVVNAQYPMLS